MTPIFANNAATTLSGTLNTSATTLSVATGTGALFASPAAGQFFALDLNDAATGLLNEIVYVTAVTGDTMTVIRGQEGTSARAWAIGDSASNNLTAGTIGNLWLALNAKPQYITSTTTITVPAWSTSVNFKIWGAGGSGGVSATTSTRASGGGAGGYAEGEVTGLTPGSTITVTIGSGGASVSSGSGNAGGTSSFGSYATCTGGGAGNGTNPYPGGFSGVGSLAGGVSGAFYGLGDGSDGNITASQPGGDGGGAGGRGAQGGPAYPGRGAGGGGGGNSSSGSTSGAGAGGLCIVKFSI